MPGGVSGEWSGTTTEIPEQGVSCLPAPIPVPTSALTSQSGDRIHIDFDINGGCFGGDLRFNGSLNGATLDGVLQMSNFCPLEARATGTATADGIHLRSEALEGTCGLWIGAEIDLKPAPASNAETLTPASQCRGPFCIPGGQAQLHR
jgi:hypothetical protein